MEFGVSIIVLKRGSIVFGVSGVVSGNNLESIWELRGNNFFFRGTFVELLVLVMNGL